MIRFYLSKNEQENLVIRAAYEGCPEEKVLTTLDDYSPSDVAVVMGVYKKYVPISFPRGHVISEQKSRGLDCLILETGYINRGSGLDNYYAFGWNGLNGRADFKNAGSPPDRKLKLGVELKPWRDSAKEDYVLLCGQVPWDASVDFTDHVQWLNLAAETIHQSNNRKIVYRPHPLAPRQKVVCDEVSIRSLKEDLSGAHCVVCFNSNTGVDAILAGVPVFSHDKGSMVYSVSSHDWDIEKPLKPDRTQWLNDICYAQWTPEEFREGTAWSHILRTYRQPAYS